MAKIISQELLTPNSKRPLRPAQLFVPLRFEPPQGEVVAPPPDSPAKRDSKAGASTRQKSRKKKRTGILSRHEGELSAREDISATASFGYFRTPSGRPPMK